MRTGWTRSSSVSIYPHFLSSVPSANFVFLDVVHPQRYCMQTKLSEYQKSVAFTGIPSPLEILAFCFVPTACFVGPQFSWRHYQSFIDQTLRPAVVLKNRTFIQKYFRNPKLHRTLSRLATGILFMILHVASRGFVSMEYMLTDVFLKKSNFFYRLGYMIAFSQFLIMRYLCIWLFSEGSCILMGLGCTGNVHVQYLNGSQPSSQPKNYTGTVNTSTFRKTAVLGGGGATMDYDFQALEKDVLEGRAVVTEADHTKCANISVVRFQSATNTDLLVSSFNINTNKWMLEYVYKRLRFLGNKQLSQIITLLFLSVWHGFYSGYYVNFFLEFITVYAEKEFLYIVRRSIYADFLYNTLPGKILTSVMGKLHALFLLACPLCAFSLLRANLWIPVLSSVYFIGFIYLLWPLVRPLVKRLFPRKPEAEAKKDS
uniref:Lysophospholipid acyltransferase 5 n=1 Tax=Schistocephalus solidus TaxID=70667 RepID=A0A0V0J7Q3_SCHSO